MGSRGNRGNKKRVSSKPFFTLSALAFALIIGLGFFRFNAAQLELRLSRIERSIARYAIEETELRQVLSGLTSPIRIYRLCKEQLGMIRGTHEIVEVVNVQRTRMASTPPAEPQKGWRASVFALFGFKLN